MAAGGGLIHVSRKPNQNLPLNSPLRHLWIATRALRAKALVERNIRSKRKASKLSQRVKGCDLARDAEIPAQLEERKQKAGVSACTYEHGVDLDRQELSRRLSIMIKQYSCSCLHVECLNANRSTGFLALRGGCRQHTPP